MGKKCIHSTNIRCMPVTCQALCWALGRDDAEGMILASVLQTSGSQSVAPGTAASSLPGNVQDMQLLRPQLRSTLSETESGAPLLPVESDASYSLRTTALDP